MSDRAANSQSVDRSRVLALLYAAIDEVNSGLAAEKQLAKSPQEALFGAGGRLDSLGLVNLVVALEQHLFEAFQHEVVIASEAAMSRRNSPFRTVESLAEYTLEVLSSDEGDGR